MERLSEAQVSQPRVDYWRLDHVAAASTRGEDDDLTDQVDGVYLDRRDRAVVAYWFDGNDVAPEQGIFGRWKPSALKRDDDVMCGGVPVRVVGPARHRGYFLAMFTPWFGDSVITCEAAAVTDRAPSDAGEQAMPIIPGVNDPNAEDPRP